MSKKIIHFPILLFFFTMLCLGNYANGKNSTEIDEAKHISKSTQSSKLQTSHKSQNNIEQAHNKNGSSYAKNVKANSDTFNPVNYCSFKGYKNSGSFVEVPAHVGDWTGYIIGVFPAIIITEPFRLVPIYGYEGDNIGEYILYGTTKTFGCLFGGPSFILKGIFWDAPIWVYSSISGNQPVSKSPVKHEDKKPVRSVAQKKSEAVTPVSYHKWQSEKVKHPGITSISAKPFMLEKSDVSAKRDKPIVKKSKRQVLPPNMSKQLFYDNTSAKDETSKYDETSWSSPPPLPDWVNKEIDKK